MSISLRRLPPPFLSLPDDASLADGDPLRREEDPVLFEPPLFASPPFEPPLFDFELLDLDDRDDPEDFDRDDFDLLFDREREDFDRDREDFDFDLDEPLDRLLPTDLDRLLLDRDRERFLLLLLSPPLFSLLPFLRTPLSLSLESFPPFRPPLTSSLPSASFSLPPRLLPSSSLSSLLPPSLALSCSNAHKNKESQLEKNNVGAVILQELP
ncbi:unnamed protein product [Closterium sp. Naga37s-1]|nr:unnamed protein product [Closterium sp. Naga37s-1]